MYEMVHSTQGFTYIGNVTPGKQNLCNRLTKVVEETVP